MLAAYSQEIQAVQARGSYPTVDAIRMPPEHPDREALRRKFLAEHTHAEDEVRFFVEVAGCSACISAKRCCRRFEADDWISVPAGTKHWFDMGAEPSFCAIRFFDNLEGRAIQWRPNLGSLRLNQSPIPTECIRTRSGRSSSR